MDLVKDAIERWLFAVDGRWLDYQDAKFFGNSGFLPDGGIRGRDWRGIFAVAAGAQYQWTDALSVRAGYSWNQNPVSDHESLINTVAPLLLEHTVYAGASWNVTPDLVLSLAYMHGFENSIRGPFVTPAGPVPYTSVTNSTSADAVVLGATLRLGGPRHCGPCAAGPGPVESLPQ